jgi:hypothetical protein
VSYVVVALQRIDGDAGNFSLEPEHIGAPC